MPNLPQRSHPSRENSPRLSRWMASSGRERANSRTSRKNSAWSGLTHSTGCGEPRLTGLAGGLLADLLVDQLLDVADRAEVVGGHVRVVDLDVELLLQERHQLHQPERVHDPGQQRRVVVERRVGVLEEDLLLDEVLDAFGRVHVINPQGVRSEWDDSDEQISRRVREAEREMGRDPGHIACVAGSASELDWWKAGRRVRTSPSSLTGRA